MKLPVLTEPIRILTKKVYLYISVNSLRFMSAFRIDYVNSECSGLMDKLSN